MIRAERYVRLYADDAGDTYLEEMTVPLAEVQFAPPAPAMHVSDPMAVTRMTWVRFPADWNDAAHPSPRRQLFILLSGEIEGWTSKGVTRRFYPGDCVLMEDTVGKGHGARPVGGEALAVMIALE